jgi:hypothetical protein
VATSSRPGSRSVTTGSTSSWKGSGAVSRRHRRGVRHLARRATDAHRSLARLCPGQFQTPPRSSRSREYLPQLAIAHTRRSRCTPMRTGIGNACHQSVVSRGLNH